MLRCDLFADPLEKGLRLGDALLYVGIQIGERVRRQHASVMQLARCQPVDTTDRNHRSPASGARGRGHTYYRFPVEGLLIEGAFTGDHEIRAGKLFLETDQLQDQLDSRSELSAQECKSREADTAGRARTRRIPQIPPGRPGHHVCPSGQRCIKLRDLPLVRTFLGAVDSRSSLRPGQRVVHVARHHDLDPSEPLAECGQVEGGRRSQRCAAVDG